MDITRILDASEGEVLFLLGNEAAVRGALESGVSVASSYPGTPSSEIGDVLSKIADEAEIYFEFSTNEKVALEVAAAAAVSGVRSFTFMKHVGLNVASDSLMSIAYTGVRGGMVILTADDPSMFSSQNEQDNRHYAQLANIPLLEPSNPQEVKDTVKYGFQLSEELETPVIIRTTTRVSHMRGVVNMDSIIKAPLKGFFHKDPTRFVPMPKNARRLRSELMNKIGLLQEYADNSILNQLYRRNGGLGVITSGGSFNYVMHVIEENNLPISVLKLTFTYPFPEEKVLKFMKTVEEILVVEEVDPIMEQAILALKAKNDLKTVIHGKLDDTLPLIYEYNPQIILTGISKLSNFTLIQKSQETELKLPERVPNFCPGCPHRAVYYTIKKVMKDLNLVDVIFPMDIGCYSLGTSPPYNAGDYLLSMGSSIGTSCGFSKVTDQRIISFIGDSTFFHAGIPPLINAVHNKVNFVLIILDNRTTAMTGGQTHPGIPFDSVGEDAPEISIEKIVEGVGVKFVRSIYPLNLRDSASVFREALNHPGVSVIISKHPCTLINKGEKRNFVFDLTDCHDCTKCLDEIGCPAIYAEGDSIGIDLDLCRGCGICIKSCPYDAIKVRRKYDLSFWRGLVYNETI